MRKFLLLPLAPDGFKSLLKYNLGVCFIVIVLLEIWRPCFFLTDDNLSSALPTFTELGRHLKSGQSPFIANYIFGGHYDLSRDLSFLNWHPLYFFFSLLADTPARFWIVDADAIVLILMTLVGFTILGFRLVREFNPELPAGFVVFFTASYLFSSYVLIVTSSWMNFLVSQSALPWLILGIFDGWLLRGTLLILVINLHQIFGGYAAMTVSNGLCLTFFAVGITVLRRSPIPFSNWIFGNMLAVLISSPFLVHVLEGFSDSTRVIGMTIKGSALFNIPAAAYPFSFFFGNWTDLIGSWGGEPRIQSKEFPYSSALLASAAAWCLIPALFRSTRLRGLEIMLLVLMGSLVIMTIRPMIIARIMHYIPVLRSMRWPFRECLQLLFFFHLFLLLRFPTKLTGWQPGMAIFSLCMFIFPLPFILVPTLNALTLDRKEVFSGEGEKYWAQVNLLLKPSDYYVTVIDHKLWKVENSKLPYSLMGTANFPAYYRARCASGYSPTAPHKQLLLKTDPKYWFGAFEPDQIPDLLREKPDLKLIMVDGVDPLRISMMSEGRRIDLTPYIDK